MDDTYLPAFFPDLIPIKFVNTPNFDPLGLDPENSYWLTPLLLPDEGQACTKTTKTCHGALKLSPKQPLLKLFINIKIYTLNFRRVVF